MSADKFGLFFRAPKRTDQLPQNTNCQHLREVLPEYRVQRQGPSAHHAGLHNYRRT